MARVGRMARGIVTVAKRRGAGYFVYLATGVTWPRAAYRLMWGPGAPSFARRLFAGAGRLATRRAIRQKLIDLGLLAEAPPGPRPRELEVADVEWLMDRAHAANVTGISGSFDRIARLPDGSVRFTELDVARIHPDRGTIFQAARDADRRAFNTRFGASLLTEADARRALAALRSTVRRGYREYAPIDFGGGLTFGRIASTDSGTGRWEFLNRHVVAPLVAGRRVLDLGSNNGSLPLMMLRAGAREVVAVECDPAIAEFARLNARILAWRDLRRYRMQVVTDDMRVFLARDLGPFDVVTAFCSLYYLAQEDMARIIRKAACSAATLILQANEAIDDLPAKSAVLARLMGENGYPLVEVHAPPGYARPLLVGSTAMPARPRNAPGDFSVA